MASIFSLRLPLNETVAIERRIGGRELNACFGLSLFYTAMRRQDDNGPVLQRR
jgi:hypothetical protein